MAIVVSEIRVTGPLPRGFVRWSACGRQISPKPAIDDPLFPSYDGTPLTEFLPTISPREITMPEVIVRKGEPIDRALKRLKSKLDAEGIMDEVRRLRAFETPTQKTKRKAKSNAKRAKAKFRFNTSN
ncbi:MAG: 30S ribosomal protein S21 [Chthoniobacter sp.]